MSRDRVTWRLELLRGWGERLDPEWLPSGDTAGWKRIFETEDRARQVFAAGGAGMKWTHLAEITAGIASVLEQYRMQWRVAEETAVGCTLAAPAHVAALDVPADLRPPRRSGTRGPWRVCTLRDGAAAGAGDFRGVDLAEGTAVAHRTLAGDQVWWAEPTGCRIDPPRVDGGWVPRADTDLRLVAFAAEDAVANMCAAATMGHTGPDVLSTRLLCFLGVAAHQMIMEYRAMFASAWTDLDACSLGKQHDADADVLLSSAPDPTNHGPGGRWRHTMIVEGVAREVSTHDGLAAAAASVAAQRAVDDINERWCEPLAAGPRPSL